MPRSALYSILLLAHALTACIQDTGTQDAGTQGGGADAVQVAPERPSSADPTNGVKLDWAGDGCDHADRLSNLAALSTDQVEQRLGPPLRRESFRLGERQDEFHIGLQNTYPLAKPENAEVELQEWTWTAEDCRLTVWFHRVDGNWKTFENLRWHRTAEF